MILTDGFGQGFEDDQTAILVGVVPLLDLLEGLAQGFIEPGHLAFALPGFLVGALRQDAEAFADLFRQRLDLAIAQLLLIAHLLGQGLEGVQRLARDRVDAPLGRGAAAGSGPGGCRLPGGGLFGRGCLAAGLLRAGFACACLFCGGLPCDGLLRGGGLAARVF